MGDELQKLKEIFLKRGAMSPHSDFQVKFGNFPPLKKKIQNRLSPPVWSHQQTKSRYLLMSSTRAGFNCTIFMLPEQTLRQSEVLQM